MSYALDPIGHVRTARHDRQDTPVQANLNPAEQGTLEIDPRYHDALDGLAEFDFAWLLTWLARPDEPSGEIDLEQVPYLLTNKPRRLGIFATRGPRRPNPIGLSLIRLISIHDTTVTFAGVDLVDRTPVLDIKPWVGAFDTPRQSTVRCGWFDTIDLDESATPRMLRGDTP